MPSRRIFDSNVWRGMPSFAAAPEGPDNPMLADGSSQMHGREDRSEVWSAMPRSSQTEQAASPRPVQSHAFPACKTLYLG